MPKKKIDKFDGEYKFLSNFFPCRLSFHNVNYVSSEHAYQAQKCIYVKDLYKVANAKNAGEAKKIAKKVKCRKDWDEIKDDIMYDIVLSKFVENHYLANKLKETYPAKLIEGNWWGDIYWGKCKGKGKNKLGKILMKVREHFK